MTSEERTVLEVGDWSLAVGRHSVGLPPSRTAEQVLEAYLELIGIVREERPDRLRSDDIEVLVEETGFERVFIENRVARYLATL